MLTSAASPATDARLSARAPAALGRDIAAVERGGADVIHVDVMDGHFVPNISIGPPVVRAIKRIATRPLDVHLMIEDPDRYIDDFAAAGANMLSVHVETVPHLHRTISYIKARGVKAGAVINPATPVDALEEIARDLDFVLVMSVNPGFGGQQFIPHSLDKLRRVRELLTTTGSSALIEVDGGIDENNLFSAHRVACTVQDRSAARIASCSVASADGTSPPRCTRSARRSRSASTWKSPRACAALTTPNV